MNRRINTLIESLISYAYRNAFRLAQCLNCQSEFFSDLQTDRSNWISMCVQSIDEKFQKSNLQTSITLIYFSRSLIWCAHFIFLLLFQSHFDQSELFYGSKFISKLNQTIYFREVYFTLIILLQSIYFLGHFCIRFLLFWVFLFFQFCQSV